MRRTRYGDECLAGAIAIAMIEYEANRLGANAEFDVGAPKLVARKLNARRLAVAGQLNTAMQLGVTQ